MVEPTLKPLGTREPVIHLDAEGTKEPVAEPNNRDR